MRNRDELVEMFAVELSATENWCGDVPGAMRQAEAFADALISRRAPAPSVSIGEGTTIRTEPVDPSWSKPLRAAGLEARPTHVRVTGNVAYPANRGTLVDGAVLPVKKWSTEPTSRPLATWPDGFDRYLHEGEWEPASPPASPAFKVGQRVTYGTTKQPATIIDTLPEASDKYPLSVRFANGTTGIVSPDEIEPAPAATDEAGESLSFTKFQSVNKRRCSEAFKHEIGDWSLLEWAGAMCGEAGEAANIAKKIKRRDQGHGGDWAKRRDPDAATLKAKLADEIGDVVAYLALMAEAAGLDLGECAAAKFDKISDEAGWKGERITRARVVR